MSEGVGVGSQGDDDLQIVGEMCLGGSKERVKDVEFNGVDITTTGFHEVTTVALGAVSHAGEDISLHAKGPGAQLAQGVIEQNVVFHLINQALELTQQ